MGFRYNSEQLTVGTMLRDRESWKATREIKEQHVNVFAEWTTGGLALRKQNRSEVLPARKLLRCNQKQRHGEVESEAMVTPIIKGTLVIESEETV